MKTTDAFTRGQDPPQSSLTREEAATPSEINFQFRLSLFHGVNRNSNAFFTKKIPFSYKTR